MARFGAAARLFGLAAAVFLAAMMMITVADVVLRTFFNVPVFGTFDLVELFLVAVIFLAVPGTFLRDEHVVVDIVDHVVGPRVRDILRLAGALLSLGFLVVMGIEMVQPALDTLAFGEVTLDLAIPKFVHWLPMLFGVACSVLATAAIVLRMAAALAAGDEGP